MKIDEKTKKAIIQIPKEISKLSQVVACVGKILSTAEKQKLRQKQKDFEELSWNKKTGEVTLHEKQHNKLA